MTKLATHRKRLIIGTGLSITAAVSYCLMTTLVSSAMAGTKGADVGVTSLSCQQQCEPPSLEATLAVFPSHRAITLVVDSEHTPTDEISAGQYTLSSADDGAYRTPRTALQRGLDRQVVGFTSDQTAIAETRLHLLFELPMRDGTDYTLYGPELPPAGLALHYPHPTQGTRLQVSQLGYLPTAPKYAYAGNWLGSAGALPIDDQQFHIIDKHSGDTVYTGPLVLRAMADPWSGNDVYEADFSDFQHPGNYRIEVPSLGLSDHFTIGDQVFDSAYRALGRYFYHHRNDTDIIAPWADSGYERAGGLPAHLDGQFHPNVATSVLGTGENGYRKIARGWFDAGDYGQYIPNAAPIWYVVGAALDIDAQRFGDGDFNIPESGNGIPDLLDELEWGMDWAMTLQDERDGGVWFRIASETWDSSLPAAITQPRLIAEKTTHATASFAAMAAIHSRLLAPWRPQRARQSLSAARRAWDFVQYHRQWPAQKQLYSNAPGTHAGDYSDPSALDNRLWAAAELYRTTGETRYHNAYKELVDQVSIDPTSVVSFRDQGMAALWAYINARWPDRDAALVAQAQEAVLAGARWRLQVAAQHPYRAAVHPHQPYLGWGSFAHSTRATLSLMQAWHITEDTRFLHAAMATPYPQLGANPQSLCYVTGLGQRSPRFPLSKLSRYDQQVKPLPGIPVNGPHHHLPAIWPATIAVNDAYYPGAEHSDSESATRPGYPPLRRYTDSNYLPPMSEPTIAEVARITVAYGLLRATSDITARATINTEQETSP
jgi:hypothetical protein